MKKIFLVLIILAVFVPSALFAEAPSDLEVQETTAGALTAFGMVFMMTMFGEPPLGVTVDANEETGMMVMSFNDFNADSFLAGIKGMGMVDQGNEISDIPFSSMSGVIKVGASGDIDLDLKLTGGNIKVLKLKTTDESLTLLNADGKDYSYLDEFMLHD
ncbi:MAG: hypothetical protein JEZ04_05575 [Spirochaetales bacterium]|nr:hypothetical protein [Spirochaetales bacterium]